MSAPDKDITMPAAKLALAAPREWSDFILALKRYSTARCDELVQTSLDELQKQQGRAQQCTRLVALLDDAVSAANRVTAAPAGKTKP